LQDNWLLSQMLQVALLGVAQRLVLEHRQVLQP